LFGLKDAKTVELGQGFESRFTESVGYIVFGVYNWGAVIVLLNMLIAMMTRSFDKIAVSYSLIRSSPPSAGIAKPADGTSRRYLIFFVKFVCVSTSSGCAK
jgi:hypothetical protein